MMYRRTPWPLSRSRGIALGSAAALLLAACAGGSTTSDASSGDDESSDNVAAEYESPLGDFLGWNTDFSSEDSQTRFEDEERVRQQEVAECMVAQGFEYKPVDNTQFASFSGEDEFGGLEWGSQAWTQKYGFGITTLSFSQSAVGPNLIGYPDQAFGGPEGPGGEEFNDPNDEYVQSLDQATQEAYYEALWGTEPDIDFETASEEEIDEAFQNWESNGCENQGYDSNNEQYEAFDEEFSDLLEDMDERMQSDPRLVEESQRINDCVTEAGQTYLDPFSEELYEFFQDKMGPIEQEQEAFYENYDPFEGVDFESMTEEEQETFFESNESSFSEPELSDAAKATLGEVQAQEIAMADAYDKCGASFFGGDGDVSTQVRLEYEQAFLDEHGDALAAYKGAFGN